MKLTKGMDIKNVAVYCASSSKISNVFMDAATQLGMFFAQNDITCINGAGSEGLMGAINNAVLSNGGKAIGIIPRFMVDAGWCHTKLSEVVITETIHERKLKMANMADAIIALPGGIGTLEELAEIITWKQLGLYHGAIIIINVDGYYSPLLNFFDQMIEKKFMSSKYKDSWFSVDTPKEAMELIKKLPVPIYNI